MDWIGLNLSVRPRVVHLTIIEVRVKELRDLANEALLHNLARIGSKASQAKRPVLRRFSSFGHPSSIRFGPPQ